MFSIDLVLDLVACGRIDGGVAAWFRARTGFGARSWEQWGLRAWHGIAPSVDRHAWMTPRRSITCFINFADHTQRRDRNDLGGRSTTSMGQEPALSQLSPMAHPVELRARRGSCRFGPVWGGSVMHVRSRGPGRPRSVADELPGQAAWGRSPHRVEVHSNARQVHMTTRSHRLRRPQAAEAHLLHHRRGREGTLTPHVRAFTRESLLQFAQTTLQPTARLAAGGDHQLLDRGRTAEASRG